MKPKARISVLVLGALLSVGCMKHEYVVGTGAPNGGTPAYKKWGHHFLFGLVNGVYVDIKGVCPSGNARILEKTTFVNGLVRYLAWGGAIYSPTTVQVWCGDGSTADVELTPEQVKTVAESPQTVAWVESFDPDLAERLAAAQRDARVPGDAMAARGDATASSAAF